MGSVTTVVTIEAAVMMTIVAMTTIDATMIGGDEFHSRVISLPFLSLPVSPLSKASALHQAEAFARL
jgi:hypothetical protein